MAPKKIIVYLSDQRLSEFEGENLKFKFKCVTGDSKHPTPLGVFKIGAMHRKYRSKSYNAQMNFAMFFDEKNGIAIHEGYYFNPDPDDKSSFQNLFSNTFADTVSYSRSLIPGLASYNIGFSNINIIGSHGCVRLSHENAIQLFGWAERGTIVEIQK